MIQETHLYIDDISSVQAVIPTAGGRNAETTFTVTLNDRTRFEGVSGEAGQAILKRLREHHEEIAKAESKQIATK